MFIHPAALYARKARESDPTVAAPVSHEFDHHRAPETFTILSPASFQEEAVQFRCKDQFDLYIELTTRMYVANTLGACQHNTQKRQQDTQLHKEIFEATQPQLKRMSEFSSGWQFTGNRQRLLCLTRNQIILHAELANVRPTMLPPHQQPRRRTPLVDICFHPVRKFALGKNQGAIISSIGAPARGWTIFLNIHQRHAPQAYAHLLKLLETSRIRYLCSLPTRSPQVSSKLFTQLFIEEQDLMHVIAHAKILLQNGWLESSTYPSTTRVASGISIRRIPTKTEQQIKDYKSAFAVTEQMLRNWQSQERYTPVPSC